MSKIARIISKAVRRLAQRTADRNNRKFQHPSKRETNVRLARERDEVLARVSFGAG